MNRRESIQAMASAMAAAVVPFKFAEAKAITSTCCVSMGTVEKVQVFNYALSPEQVRQLYLRSSLRKGDPAYIVAEYAFPHVGFGGPTRTKGGD